MQEPSNGNNREGGLGKPSSVSTMDLHQYHGTFHVKCCILCLLLFRADMGVFWIRILVLYKRGTLGNTRMIKSVILNILPVLCHDHYNYSIDLFLQLKPLS